jgi:hypothetical protein
MASFRDRFLTPKVANAITSPSAIVAVGAGAAAGILVGLGPLGAVALGAGAWAARVLAAVPRNPPRDVVSPRSLSDPWRSLLADVQASRGRFDDALRGVRAGPLRDRLGGVGDRLDTAIDEAGRIARAGNTLTDGRRRIDADGLRRELAETRALPVTDRTEQMARSVQSQLDAAERLDRTIADTYERLRLLDARIDETVTRTVELSVTQGDADDLGGLDAEVDSIVGEMEALRQAVEETDASWTPELPGSSDASSVPPPDQRPMPGTGP